MKNMNTAIICCTIFLLVFKITMTSLSVCKGSLNQVPKHRSIILLKVTVESCHCIPTLVGWKGNSLQQSWNGEVPHPSNSSATSTQEVRLNRLHQLKGRSTFPQRNMCLLNSFCCSWSFYSDLMLKLDLLISVLQVSLECCGTILSFPVMCCYLQSSSKQESCLTSVFLLI